MSPAEFIAALGPAARGSPIPAGVTIAQGALESTWGSSDLAVKARNLFSVKADASWRGAVVLMDSVEYVKGKRVMLPARWRFYATWADCVGDRVNFLKTNPRYAHCWEQTTASGWARALQAANYATDPHYADKLIALMTQYHLL